MLLLCFVYSSFPQREEVYTGGGDFFQLDCLYRLYFLRQTVEHLHGAVILQLFPADAFRQNEICQRLRVIAAPSGQQVLQPVIPVGVCHTVADHHGKAPRLQRHGGEVRGGGAAPKPDRQAAAADAADGAALFEIAGGGTEFIKRRLAASEHAQIHSGEAAGLRTPEGHGGVQSGQRRLRLNVRL